MPNDYQMGPEGAEWITVIVVIGVVVVSLMYMGKWIL